MLISTGRRVRGGLGPAPPISKTTSPIIKKIVRGLGTDILSTNMQFQVNFKHFCGNESKSNFRLRTRSELAANKMWYFGDVWTQQMDNFF